MNASVPKLQKNLCCGQGASRSRTPTVTLVIARRIGFTLMGLDGWRAEFYFIESAITAGLCVTNPDGTGGVYVFSASKRMAVMPFARIFTSIGGVRIIFLCGSLASYIR